MALHADPSMRLAWDLILEDIAYLLGDELPGTPHRESVSQEELARYLNTTRGTVRGWLCGSEPKHGDGEAILAAWCRLSGKVRTYAPRTRRPMSAAELR